MRRYIVLGVLLMMGLGLKGQFGLRMNYIKSSAPNWETIQHSNTSQFSHISIYEDGFKIGLDYWTRLPQKRVEFYPEISFSSFKSTSFSPTFHSIEYSGKLITALLNTNFYLLDFSGDCDCPTFSKKGNLFKKGFYISTHLGAQRHTKNFANSAISYSSISPVAGLGLGLDVGITDLITITPFMQYQIAFGDNWESLAMAHNQSDLEEFEITSFKQLQFGFRIGFRPDYK